jgi:hypothetical protein
MSSLSVLCPCDKNSCDILNDKEGTIYGDTGPNDLKEFQIYTWKICDFEEDSWNKHRFARVPLVSFAPLHFCHCCIKPATPPEAHGQVG